MTKIDTIRTGEISVYRATVEVPCSWRADKRLRRQKQIKVKTKNELNREVKKFEYEVQRIAYEIENRGFQWSELVDEYELSARKDIGIRFGELTVNDRISAIHSYTKSWMSRPASSITIVDVEDCLSKMARNGKSYSRVRFVRGAISAIFEFAIRRGRIKNTVNPARGAFIPLKEIRRQPEILTRSEIQELLAKAKEANHPWYHVWAFALLTGMRSSEIYSIRWSDIDADGKRITVSKSYDKKAKTDGPTKGRYTRTVPVGNDLHNLLTELRFQRNGPHIFPRLSYWARGEAARVIRQFCIAAGLKSIKFHTLRACFATQLLQDGVQPIVVMKVGGWRDLKTMQRYIRLSGIEDQGATDSLCFLPKSTALLQVCK